MITVFWDIDGTLLTTARAGIAAWEDGLRSVTGVERSLETFHTAGLTDVEIAHLLLADVGFSRADAGALIRAYEERLAGVLGQRAGRVLPFVADVLQDLQRRPTVRMLLLTGNTRAGARAKLGHYGLARFFDHGAFADDADDRPGVARVALSIARQQYGEVDLSRAFVVGDTPADIACGRAIGVKTIAVATGGYTIDQLREHEPTIAFSELPDPPTFADALGLR